MRDKSGWIRILEATIAVMIVSGVMVAVYSDQSSREDFSIADYSYSVQSQILADITSNSTLRLEVLNVTNDIVGDVSYDVINEFVNESIPSSFEYLLKICNLNDTSDHCKMDNQTFIDSMDTDVFVEEVIISAEIGDGTGNGSYSPKRVRLFFWEGGLPEEGCSDECSSIGLISSVCSGSGNSLINKSCVDMDGCLRIINTTVPCGTGEVCDSNSNTCVAGSSSPSGTCIASDPDNITCEGNSLMRSSCSDGDGDGVYNWNESSLVETCSYDEICSDSQDMCVGPCSSGGCNPNQIVKDCSIYGENLITENCSYSIGGGCYEKGTDIVKDCSLISGGYCDDNSDSCEVASCGDSCASLGYECGVHEICGASVDCGECVADLVATITMTTEDIAGVNCNYNICNYNISVVNNGNAPGTVWKRVGNGVLIEEYNQEFVPGESRFLGVGGGKSTCYLDKVFNIEIYDNEGNIIGSETFTCYHP